MSEIAADSPRDAVTELLLRSSLLVLYVSLRGTARALGAARALIVDGPHERT